MAWIAGYSFSKKISVREVVESNIYVLSSLGDIYNWTAQCGSNILLGIDVFV